MRERFWEYLPLHELTEEEWEALCDGCAQCCRLKFQDIATHRIATTTIVCRLLDVPTRRCKQYPKRHELVEDCIELKAENVSNLRWLPDTCGYRRVAEERPLEDWHPLISGTRDTVAKAGVSISDQVISEDDVHPDDIDLHVLKWVT